MFHNQGYDTIGQVTTSQTFEERATLQQLQMFTSISHGALSTPQGDTLTVIKGDPESEPDFRKAYMRLVEKVYAEGQ